VELNEFLAFKETSLGQVVAEAERSMVIHDDEMLLAVGSLVEGLGTTKSDLDLLLLTRRSAEELPPDEHVTWVSGKCLVDMRVLPGLAVEDLLGRFARWSGAPWDPTHASHLNLEQRTLLHRISNGPRLARGEPPPDIHARPDPRALARLKLHVARHEARTVQVDMAGLQAAGDFRSLAFAGSQLMGLTIDAILAGHLMTNPLIKWRSRLLDDVPGEWQAQLGPRMGGRAGDTIWDLLRFPRTYRQEDALDYALRISAYARAAFAWVEAALLAPDDADAPAAPVGAGVPGEPLPFLDFDVDYSIGGNAVSLGRLNEFGQPLRISRADLEAALLFDGRTGADEADAWVYSRLGERVDSRALRERCAGHGLLAEPRGP
jgi:hypothetical protein